MQASEWGNNLNLLYLPCLGTDSLFFIFRGAIQTQSATLNLRLTLGGGG